MDTTPDLEQASASRRRHARTGTLPEEQGLLAASWQEISAGRGTPAHPHRGVATKTARRSPERLLVRLGHSMMPTTVSVVIPALDEAACIAAAIDAVRAAFTETGAHPVRLSELLVVDNASRDATAEIAAAHGATVVIEPVRGVARARNSGARVASGSVLLFLDADTVLPPGFAPAFAECIADAHCLGGAFATQMRPRRLAVRLYLGLWQALGSALGMAQGAAQFCRRECFESLRGYDESLHMGEDVDFYWRLKRLARAAGMRTTFIHNVRVPTSARRFDQWPLWKSLLWTNPVVVALLRRRARTWRGWYEAPPR